jgi:OmpA-OmpF porin, OOP family
LSPQAKSMLDEIATQAKSEKGFVIEVRGFASADGAENSNRVLSQRRAEVVMRYLAENHNIPLRRIVLPFGYGEAMPIADNSRRDGRIQNRRTEVSLLVSKGLTTPVTVNRSVGSNRQP